MALCFIFSDEVVGHAAGDSAPSEKLSTDKVRYLRGIGMEKRLKSQHGVTARFKHDRGESSLTLLGAMSAVEDARDTIRNEPGMFRWYRIPIQGLQKLRSMHGALIIQQLKNHHVCVGWGCNLKSSRLYVYSKDVATIERGLDILLDLAGLTRDDIQQPSQSSRNVVDEPPQRGQPMGRHFMPHEHSRSSSAIGKLEDINLEILAFMWATLLDYVKKTEKELNVTINVDTHKSFIEIKGNRMSVHQAVERTRTYLNNLYVKQVERPGEYMNCLSKEVKRAEILDSLKRAQVKVGWDFREGKLWLCGDSRARVDKAEEAVCGLILGGEYPAADCLTPAQRQSVVLGDKWKEHKEALTKANPTLHISFDADSSKIVFAVKDKDAYHSIIDSLFNFFAPTKSAVHA